MADIKVYLEPQHYTDDNGVGRIVKAQRQYLPQFGIRFVQRPDEADVIAAHLATNQKRISVLHNHGVYWTADSVGTYSDIHAEANHRVVECARRAQVITVPSEWVATPFRRDMRVNPVVIGHGIDFADWQPGENRGYVLWNKNRNGDVCNPAPVQYLAERAIEVVTTFAPSRAPRLRNLKIVGLVSHQEMRDWIQHADVYLATTQETFGIGTLEAMACGVPVLGYDWGGTRDIVRQNIDGLLVKPGDMDALLKGYQWLREHREEVSVNARERAKEYDWQNIIGQYAEVYRGIEPEREGVAVIITNHNKGAYVQEAVDSVLAQSYPVAEIVVVDDGSTDDSLSRLERYAGRVEIIKQTNQGVAAARNNGICRTGQPFCICLDADDRLAPAYVETCYKAIKQDRALGVVYTGLGFIEPTGVGPNIWNAQFDWEIQARPSVPPSTTIHCAAMFRRELWERSGGYKQRYAPGEDTEFFTRGLSLGFTAKRVTDAPLFEYRNTPKSASKTKPYIAINDDKPWMVDKQFPFAAPAKIQPKVHSYANPLVSVIIPVGPGHAIYLADALDSLLGQTFRDWEAVVVNDTGDKLDTTVYPFIRMIDTAGGTGAGHARNVGIDHARAPLVFFLDVDDLIHPTILSKMLKTYATKQAGYVYSGWHFQQADGTQNEDGAPEYDQQSWLRKGQHAISVLMAREDAQRIGGFDEQMQGWEDWDFFIKCAIAGVCGVAVHEPLFTYRQYKGKRSDKIQGERRDLLRFVHERYADYIDGSKAMGKCCGGNKAAVDAIMSARLGTGRMDNRSAIVPEGMIRMQFIGPQRGPITYYVNGHPYAGANTDEYRFLNAKQEDVSRLESMGVWRRARVDAPLPPVLPVVPPPATVVAEVELAPEPEPEPVTTLPEIAATETVPEPIAEPSHNGHEQEPTKPKRTRKRKVKA